jgi:hypothetical protein
MRWTRQKTEWMTGTSLLCPATCVPLRLAQELRWFRAASPSARSGDELGQIHFLYTVVGSGLAWSLYRCRAISKLTRTDVVTCAALRDGGHLGPLATSPLATSSPVHLRLYLAGSTSIMKERRKRRKTYCPEHDVFVIDVRLLWQGVVCSLIVFLAV